MTTRHLRTAALAAAASLAVLALAGFRYGDNGEGPPTSRFGVPHLPGSVTAYPISYRAHNGRIRGAFVLVPAWYGPDRHPAIPLVIAPHGRGVGAAATCELWGALPATGSFAVVCPEGQGARLTFNSWGAPSQIADLARMPAFVRKALPWVHVDRRRIYAVGGSMGGQETLLLVAHFPRLLAGAIAFDPVADFVRQYRAFPSLPCNRSCVRVHGRPLGRVLQRAARLEVGGPPAKVPMAWANRSPMHFVREIAKSGVPLELWWSKKDRVVRDQARQSGAFFDRMRALEPDAPVEAFVGYWRHSHEQSAAEKLPFALAQLGLLPDRYLRLPGGVQEHHFIPRRRFVRDAR